MLPSGIRKTEAVYDFALQNYCRVLVARNQIGKSLQKKPPIMAALAAGIAVEVVISFVSGRFGSPPYVRHFLCGPV